MIVDLYEVEARRLHRGWMRLKMIKNEKWNLLSQKLYFRRKSFDFDKPYIRFPFFLTEKNSSTCLKFIFNEYDNMLSFCSISFPLFSSAAWCFRCAAAKKNLFKNSTIWCESSKYSDYELAELATAATVKRSYFQKHPTLLT